MREIKFRAKCPQSNNWIYGYPVFYQDTCDFYVLQDVVLDKENNYVEYLPVRHFVKLETVSQYTGLKDKNGVEIYEGDIVHYPIKGEGSFLGHVHYDEKECFYCVKESDSCLDSDFEVIGNIYENPELLEQTK